MNCVFVNLQKLAYTAISTAPCFIAQAASTVFEDVGNSTPKIEDALDVDNGGAGFAISVWPPARGTATDSNSAGVNGVLNTIVVRFEVNPKVFTLVVKDVQNQDIIGVGGDDVEQVFQIPDPSKWINEKLKSITEAVLSIQPGLGDILYFQLAPEFYELINFDPGLMAYHLRFNRFTVI